MEYERRHELYRLSQKDMEYKKLSKEYFEALLELNIDWNNLSKSNSYKTKDGMIFEQKCIMQINRFLKLVPKWKRYEEPVPRTDAYKHLAKLYEKQGNLNAAARICADAIKAGFPDDGTKGGMQGRLDKLVKKGATIEN